MAYPVLADGRRRIESMTYDVRGNPRESTDSSNYQLNGDGSHTYATTRYEYTNPAWPDLVTRIVRPESDSTVMEYDANGNLAWRQDGRGVATRVTFGYYTLAGEPGYAPGLLRSISAAPPPPELSPRTVCTGREVDNCTVVVDTIYPPPPTEKVEYDTLGNVRATVTARGFRTTFHNDALGRLSLTESPIDGSRVRMDSTVYDALGRVIARVSRAPRMTGSTPSAPERAVVRNWYDEEGNLRRVDRWADPDQAEVDTIITRWERDAAGRVTAQFSPDGTPADSTDNPFDRTAYDPAGNPSRVRTRRWASARLLVPSDTLADLRMEYDALNRLTKRRVPAVRYAPRHEGLAAQRSDLNSDGNNPDYPRFPTDAEGGYTIPADSSTFAYDAVGNLTRADNGDAEVRRTYYVTESLHTDTLRIRTLLPFADGSDWRRHEYVIQYNYDLNGRVVGIGHPDQLAPKPSGLLYRATRYSYEAGSA
jgi:YD repeat-containing protein